VWKPFPLDTNTQEQANKTGRERHIYILFVPSHPIPLSLLSQHPGCGWCVCVHITCDLSEITHTGMSFVVDD